MRELFKACGRVVALGALLLALVPAVRWPSSPKRRPRRRSRAAGGEANLVLPDLGQTDVGGYNGRSLLMVGLLVSFAGILFGLVILNQLKNMPVHRSMREISELIYETCKTYLITQGRFLVLLELFIAAIIILYFGVLSGLGTAAGRHHPALQRRRHPGQLRRGVVRHPRQHLRQFADGVCQPQGHALPGATPSRSRPA